MKSFRRPQIFIPAVLSLLLCAGFAFGEPPQDETQVPAFPGAKLLAESGTNDAPSATEPPASATVDRSYEAAATPEDVVAFYVKTLGVEPEADTDPAPAKVWQAEGVMCIITYYSEEEAAAKSGLSKRAKIPWASGWVKSAIFRWDSTKDNGNAYTFNLNVDDKGGSAPKTGVSLAVVMGNRDLYQKRQAEAAAKLQAGVTAFTAAIEHVDPEKKKLVDEVKANPPSAKELDSRLKAMFGVPLYPGATLQVKAMEIYMQDLWGGVGGYWFLSKDSPKKLIEYYQKITGNNQYMVLPSTAHFIDITDKNHKLVAHIAIYQGTTEANLGLAPENATMEDTVMVSTLGLYLAKPGEKVRDTGAGGR